MGYFDGLVNDSGQGMNPQGQGQGMYPQDAGMYPQGAGMYPQDAGMYPQGAGMYPPDTGMYQQGQMPYQQGYPQGYGNGYGAYPQGRVDGYGFVHYTHGQYLDGLRNFVMMNTQMAISQEDKLEEMPNGMFRHACAPAKISYLSPCRFDVPETGVSIPFFFCKACGRLYYFKDFM